MRRRCPSGSWMGGTRLESGTKLDVAGMDISPCHTWEGFEGMGVSDAVTVSMVRSAVVDNGLLSRLLQLT